MKINLRGLRRRGGGRARPMFDDGHFAENFAGAEPRKNPAGAAPTGGDFHQPGLDEINAVAGRALLENLLPGGETAVPAR